MVRKEMSHGRLSPDLVAHELLLASLSENGSGIGRLPEVLQEVSDSASRSLGRSKTLGVWKKTRRLMG